MPSVGAFLRTCRAASQIGDHLKGTTPRNALFITDELTMKQISHMLSVAEFRVCQKHMGILNRLQQRLADLDGPRLHQSMSSPVLWRELMAREGADA